MSLLLLSMSYLPTAGGAVLGAWEEPVRNTVHVTTISLGGGTGFYVNRLEG